MQEEVILTDASLVHRLIRVVRLRGGQQCILFDRFVHLHVQVISMSRGSVTMQVLARDQNKALVPFITLLLPLLKKDALAQAIYGATEKGVSRVQLISTAKSRKKITHVELERLERIVTTAAEQAKQFVFPEIKPPIVLNKDLCERFTQITKLYADLAGTALFNQLSLLKRKDDLLLMVGPEGDLAQNEKELLWQSSFTFCRLTPTILRSSQAASFFVGVCRAYFS